MKLQLLITQYKETEDLIRPMLMSIEMQKGIDLKNDIEVIIGNDGSDVKLSKDFLGSFSYPIMYRQYEHSGLPGCRQNLLSDATAEYVMFCDADDEFCLNIGLHTIFSYMEKGFDAFVSKFYEEVIPKNGKAVYIPHDRDKVFVHGKVYRRQFLTDNKIVWHPELKYQEDACFNNLALSISGKTIYCTQAFYLWKFRADSMCRSVCMNDPLFLLKTFPGTVDSDEQLITDLVDRGKNEAAVHLSNGLLFKWFFMMQKPEWNRPENVKYTDSARQRIRAFHSKHGQLINAVSAEERDKAYQSLRKQGNVIDMEFNDWLKEILDSGIENAVNIALSETDQRYQAVKDIQGSGRLDFDGRKVKTIAAYCTRMSNGGTERVISILSSLWSSMGYNVILLTDDTGTDNDYAIPQNVKRVTIHEFNGFTKKDLRERAAILQRIMTENQIDLVVYNAEFSPLLLLDELVIKACGAAFVIYCHSMFTFPMKLKKPDLKSFTIPYLLADAVVTLNDMNRDFWSHFNRNVYSITNPLVEQPGKWKQSSCSSHQILFVGRLSREKRPFDALKIWELVNKAIPDAELHIVGKSENGKVEEALKKIIEDRGFESKVFLHGYCSDVKQFYQDASVLLVTSELEGYSLSIQESMLSGIPCVAYDMPYLTLSKVNRGMVSVSQGDVAAAAGEIIALFRDDGKRKLMGALARQSIQALEDYDFKGAWNKIFQSIYERNRGGSRMKLQILITQYKETEEIIEPMLTSIETQQGIDLKNDIEVIIGNDGSDVKLSRNFLDSFSFPIKYKHYEHSGLPGCRKNLFDDATADYVMFCDADDMFINNLAFNIIFSYIEKGFDAFVCDFIEEIVDQKTRKSRFFPHKKDHVFVHGKIYRRQYLLDNGIVWHPELRCHEDSCFNILAQSLAENFEYCPIPLYLWKWRDQTICRGDSLYVPKTYVHMIESSEKLIRDFLDRGRLDDAKKHAVILTYGTYYMLNKPIWRDPLNVKYRYLTEKRFQEYYRKHRNLIRSIDPRMEQSIIRGTKTRVLGEGVLLESFTFDAWIRHIEEL